MDPVLIEPKACVTLFGRVNVSSVDPVPCVTARADDMVVAVDTVSAVPIGSVNQSPIDRITRVHSPLPPGGPSDATYYRISCRWLDGGSV